jgi:hypothetical protein
MSVKTYSELITFSSFKERYKYLRLSGTVGEETFGFDRYLNQLFYKSREWKRVRNEVIIRDNGCDLGIEGCEIHGKIIIHHMNPIRPKDFINNVEELLNPEYLITTVLNTHNAIHYGDESLLLLAPPERSRNDTCPWRH